MSQGRCKHTLLQECLSPVSSFVHPPTHPQNRKCKQLNDCLSFFVFHPTPPKKKHIPSQTTTNDNQRQRQRLKRHSHVTRWPEKNLHTWHSSRVPLNESTQNALRQGASWRVKNKDLQLMRQLKLQVQGAIDAERMFRWCNWSGGVSPPLDGKFG